MTLIGVVKPSFRPRSLGVRQRIESVVRLGSCPERALSDVVELVRDHLTIAAACHGSWIRPEGFAEHVLAHAALERRGFIGRLATLHSADLYLALAAAMDIPDAVARLEELHIRPIVELVSRVHGGAPYAAEIQKRVRSTLLHATPRTRLRDYSGRSSLRDWMRVHAVRELRDARKASERSLVTSPSRTGDRSPDLPASTAPL